MAKRDVGSRESLRSKTGKSFKMYQDRMMSILRIRSTTLLEKKIYCYAIGTAFECPNCKNTTCYEPCKVMELGEGKE